MDRRKEPYVCTKISSDKKQKGRFVASLRRYYPGQVKGSVANATLSAIAPPAELNCTFILPPLSEASSIKLRFNKVI